MDFRFNEEQLELGRAARRFLEVESSSERVRAAMESERGFDPAVYKRIAEELGWLAVTIPEEYEGLGLGAVDLMPILEEMGRFLYCGPFFSTICLGVNALLLGGDDAQKGELLPYVARGETTLTLAHAEARAKWDSAEIECEYEKRGDDYVLSGEKRYVLDGLTADRVVVAARAKGSKGAEGISLFLVSGEADGLSKSHLPTVDMTRREAALTFREVHVARDALVGEEGAGHALLERILDRARAALAVEQVGGAERCLDMAVAYSLERKQFGRVIGSFQAIKHMAADMLWRVENARSIAYAANVAVDAGDDAEIAEMASAAKATASTAFFQNAADNIQIHGGVGFTWEFDPHLYFKRAKASEEHFGSPAMHRERVARAMGL
ncbi:MAG: acyl-CoA dehydrogenase [Myxococcales bacterium]|nr:acyl-CoA dehydrogenase [Myxococcales bacterium]